MNLKHLVSPKIALPLGMLTAVCLQVVQTTSPMAQAAPPQQRHKDRYPGRILSARERKAADEATIQLAMLRQESHQQGATHVGIEGKESMVEDLSPEMMRTLLAITPTLQPASALIRLGNPTPKGHFILLTVGDLEWQSKDQVVISGIYRSPGGGRNCSDGYVATRGKASKTNTTGWVIKRELVACGFWSKFTLRHIGKPTVIKNRGR